MGYSELSKDLYNHLEKMREKDKIYFIKKWDNYSKDELEDVINKNFIKEKRYVPEYGLYVIIGLANYEFYQTDVHAMLLMGQRTYLANEDITSIIKLLNKYSRQEFDIVPRAYYFLGQLISVIWFAPPEMVAEMKNAKELLFSEDDITDSFEKDTLASNEPVKEEKSNDSIQVEIDEQSFSLERQESLEVIEQTLDASEKDEPTKAKDMNTTATVGDDENSKIIELLKVVSDQELSTKEIMARLGLAENSRKLFTKNYREPAEASNLIEKTIKDKPKSKLQKYCLTQLGRKKLASLN